MRVSTTGRAVRVLLAVLLGASLVISACSGAAGGGPGSPGSYSVQPGSVHFDGERYTLFWADSNGALHEMQTRRLRMVRDPERTFLEVAQGGGDPTLHLREDEPITVEGQDRQGSFTSSWFPFLLGATLGNALGGRSGGGPIVINQPAPGERGGYDPGTPAYRYPPTGTFGRDDELHGTLDTSRPQAPDYRRVEPAPYATSGKSSGTGGGVAASNKAPGGATGIGGGASTSATSGQSGGTGGGTAASSKGGFKTGDQSFASREAPSSSIGAGSRGGTGAGSRGVLGGGGSSGGTSGKPSTGISGSKGIGGARVPPKVGRR